MASSFVEQIPPVIWVLSKLGPQTMLDVGKGFGKYGFLAHEYLGIPLNRAADPNRTMSDQSNLAIDAVEIQEAYLWPHIRHFYRDVIVGDITALYSQLSGYDVVLMTDVIEHLDKAPAERVVKHFVDDGSAVVVSTPKRFFQQAVLESDWERHRSLWTPSDFRALASHVQWQNAGPGRIYVLTAKAQPIPGFGHSLSRRARRVARVLLQG